MLEQSQMLQISLAQLQLLPDLALYKNNDNNNNISGDIRESSYIFQRIAITIQRFNSVLFGDSFLPGDDFDF